MTKSLITTSSVEMDNLFVGGVMPVVTDTVNLKAGAAYSRGTVLGIITADDKAVDVDSTKTDGSQAPYAILAEDTDATDGDIVAPVYMTGEFNAAALTFGGTDTIATHKKELRTLGIFAKAVQG